MWPLAVAGLGLRYLSISVSEMLGHPFEKPFCVTFRSADILGLHKDWCENLTLLALVELEWEKFVVCWTVVGLMGCEGVTVVLSG